MTDEESLPTTAEELLATIRAGDERIDVFVASLSTDQVTGPADAAGWTVRDHLAHLNAWTDSTLGILRDGTPQAVTLGADPEALAGHDYDGINESIRQRTTDQSIDLVMTERYRMRGELDDRIRGTAFSRLREPVHAFVAGGNDYPMVGKILGNTAWHDKEHLVWMRAIVDSASTEESR